MIPKILLPWPKLQELACKTYFEWMFLNWTGFVDLADVAVHRSELFCLHSSGRLSHLSLLSADRCVERLLRRESWTLAATVCCMFQHTITTSRVRRMGNCCTSVWSGTLQVFLVLHIYSLAIICNQSVHLTWWARKQQNYCCPNKFIFSVLNQSKI